MARRVCSGVGGESAFIAKGVANLVACGGVGILNRARVAVRVVNVCRLYCSRGGEWGMHWGDGGGGDNVEHGCIEEDDEVGLF